MKRKRLYRPKGAAPIIMVGLAALYLLFSVGVIKATHFCLGREASVAYFTAESKKCACSLFAKDDHGCCDDKQELLKLDLSQKNIPQFQLALPDFSFVGELYSGLNAVRDDSPGSFWWRTDDAQPPPKLLYKVHCSFVFYDTEAIT
jgi:hypothetical protein